MSGPCLLTHPLQTLSSRCSPSSPPCKSTSPPTRLRPSLLEPLPPRQRRLEHRKVRVGSLAGRTLRLTSSERAAGPFQLKTTLLWSHHLLATSKRKDIVAWSTELSLYGLSKPGCVSLVLSCRRLLMTVLDPPAGTQA